MVPDVLDRRISRGEWASPVPSSIFRPSSVSATLGRRQCSVQTCISTTASCPDPCAHRSCPCPPWSRVMRLNSGDCTPEAQSAQRREWLPACCSCLSGCEEGAVSLVRIGEEQVGTPTPARTSASAEAWASAGTNCTAEAVQCLPTLRFAHSPVPDARPASCLPTPAQTCVGPPGHQPTCQPANPTRECGVDWQGVGAQLYCCIPSPTRHATQGQKWQARRDVLCWAAQEERTRETSEVGRHGVHQPTARGTVPR